MITNILNYAALSRGAEQDSSGSGEGSTSTGKHIKTTEITTTEEVASIHIPLANMDNSEFFLYLDMKSEIKLSVEIVFPTTYGDTRGYGFTGTAPWAKNYYGRILETKTKKEIERHVFVLGESGFKISACRGNWLYPDVEPGLYIKASAADTVFPVGARVSITEVY